MLNFNHLVSCSSSCPKPNTTLVFTLKLSASNNALCVFPSPPKVIEKLNCYGVRNHVVVEADQEDGEASALSIAVGTALRIKLTLISMTLFRTLLSHRFHSLLLNSHSLKTLHRPIKSLPEPGSNPQPKPIKKPLHALFTEALQLSEKPTTTNHDDEEGEEEGTNLELKKNLKQLEQELKILIEKNIKRVPKKPQKKGLSALFTNLQRNTVAKPKKPREPLDFKQLSPDAAKFVQCLYEKGYFKDANFARGNQSFELAMFESFFARGYIKFAALKFARDHQEIAKWLSGSALKQVAVFGCPSNDRKCVMPAKVLRKFFEVPENTVCSECTIRQSCEYVNKNVVSKLNSNNLSLEIVMKVITSYAMEFVHPQLVVPEEVKKSVKQLLYEIVKLSG
ncbi:hypothetical protein RJT34_29297 [Clitoria ternatea]|uniref:Uncharacterized protein n=1 Tax=Clitoria ternatea TaxID=43366 RepID=A0AAN9FAD1_CLITE